MGCKKILWKIERLALPTSPFSLVLVVLLASLLGGGLRALFLPSMPLLHESPHLRYETLRKSGQTEAPPKRSVHMKIDSALLNGSTTSTLNETGRGE